MPFLEASRPEGLDKRQVSREIRQRVKAEAKAELRRLRAELRDARKERAAAIRLCRDRTRIARERVRAAAKERRIQILADLRTEYSAARLALREECATCIHSARKSERSEAAKLKLDAERRYQRQAAILDRDYSKKTRAHKASRHEKARENYESVQRDLEHSAPELVPLWHRIGRTFRKSPRQARTSLVEAFTEYAAEHPSEVLEAQDHDSDKLVRELERLEREQQRELNRIEKSAPREAAKNARRKRERVPF